MVLVIFNSSFASKINLHDCSTQRLFASRIKLLPNLLYHIQKRQSFVILLALHLNMHALNIKYLSINSTEQNTTNLGVMICSSECDKSSMSNAMSMLRWNLIVPISGWVGLIHYYYSVWQSQFLLHYMWNPRNCVLLY